LKPSELSFVVDESTGRTVVDFLRDRGYRVLSIIEYDPGAKDANIIQRAYDEHRILITNDKDFGELIFRHKYPAIGFILLRLKDESPENRVRVVDAVLERWGASLEGYAVTATDSKIRRRSLPLNQ